MAYKTILGHGDGEIVEKKSRFLGHIVGVGTEDEAKAILESIKKNHHQARHNCSAYRIRGQQLTERYNDDGEPGGTAGMPMLEVLRGADLENVLVVSTRYFGGTKLGTGGLVRAYTQSAQAALSEASVIEVGRFTKLTIEVDYGMVGKLEYEINRHEWFLEKVAYEDRVTFHVYVQSDICEAVQEKLMEMTNGQVVLVMEDPQYGYVQDGQVVIGESI